MKIFYNIKEISSYRNQIINKSIGLVHTMGNLHDGHMSLIQKAKVENTIVILTIFINEAQFDKKEDYENYPRTIKEDIQLALNNKVDILFLPSTNELYPDNYNYRLTTNRNIAQIMEGEKRPGHFDGMMTIVLKVLLICKATRSYYSEKDYQQLELIKGLAKAFILDTEIISCPIIRYPSGLPLSSRLSRLTQSELTLAEDISKICHSTFIKNDLVESLKQKEIKIDYIIDLNQRRYVAFYIGNIRLIDNFPLSLIS